MEKGFDYLDWDLNFLLRRQKVFQDDKGKKYYIDVHKVSNEWMSDADKEQEWYTPYAYEYSCQLYEKGTYAAMNLEFFSD